MPTEYSVDRDLEKVLSGLLKRVDYAEYKDLRESGVAIKSCVKVCMNSDDELQPAKGDQVAVKKVSPVDFLFSKTHFIVVMDYHTWTHATAEQQESLAAKALTAIKISKNKEGVIKFGKKRPDIVEYSEHIRRYGAYHAPLLDLREMLKISTHRVMNETLGDEQVPVDNGEANVEQEHEPAAVEQEVAADPPPRRVVKKRE